MTDQCIHLFCVVSDAQQQFWYHKHENENKEDGEIKKSANFAHCLYIFSHYSISYVLFVCTYNYTRAQLRNCSCNKLLCRHRNSSVMWIVLPTFCSPGRTGCERQRSYGEAAVGEQHRRDNSDADGPSSSDAEHAHGIRECKTGCGTPRALRSRQRRAPALHKDLDMVVGGRRLRPRGNLHHLLLRVLALRPSQLDRAEQPGLHRHQLNHFQPLQIARHGSHLQDQHGSAQGYSKILLLWCGKKAFVLTLQSFARRSNQSPGYTEWNIPSSTQDFGTFYMLLKFVRRTAYRGAAFDRLFLGYCAAGCHLWGSAVAERTLPIVISVWRRRWLNRQEHRISSALLWCGLKHQVTQSTQLHQSCRH